MIKIVFNSIAFKDNFCHKTTTLPFEIYQWHKFTLIFQETAKPIKKPQSTKVESFLISIFGLNQTYNWCYRKLLFPYSFASYLFL